MKKEFFENLELILYDKSTQFERFEGFYEDFKSGVFYFDFEKKRLLKDNLHPCVKITHPRKLRGVKNADNDYNLAKLIHAVAHIEYSAIQLALDSAYRFSFLPREFYEGFLKIASDEMKHFSLLEQALNELGFKYGDFIAHDTLIAALKATANSLKYRMAVVHRGLEAKGLDANPFVQKKLENSSHNLKSFLKSTLNTILEDEITHVSAGDVWFKYAKNERESFIDICLKFKEFTLAGRVLNEDARLRAGFDEAELKELEKVYKKA